MLKQLAICSLGALFAITSVKAEENPIKPRMANNLAGSANEFQCGVYKGSEKEIFSHYTHYQAKLKTLQKTGARSSSQDFVSQDH